MTRAERDAWRIGGTKAYRHLKEEPRAALEECREHAVLITMPLAEGDKGVAVLLSVEAYRELVRDREVGD